MPRPLLGPSEKDTEQHTQWVLVSQRCSGPLPVSPLAVADTGVTVTAPQSQGVHLQGGGCERPPLVEMPTGLGKVFEFSEPNV